MARDAMNPDFERRSLWGATMPPLADRSGRGLPDTADVVVVGGGYAGITAARELARRGRRRHRSSRRRRSASGRRPGTAGSSIPATSGDRASSSSATGRRPARALYEDTLAGYETVKRLIAEEAIDCEFREVGYLELAYAPHRTSATSSSSATAWPRSASTTLVVPREKLREEIGSDAYYGGARRPGQRPPPSGPLLRRARRRPPTGPAPTCTRASRARPIRRQADGRFVVETERGAILARDVLVATNGYTDGVAPRLRRRIIPIGSYIIATEPLPEELAHELSPKGRAFFDTKNFLYYWHVSADRRMVFGGRASFLPTSIERTAAILHSGMLGSIRSWPATASTTRGAATSGSPSTGCRTPGGPATASPTRWAAAARASH